MSFMGTIAHFDILGWGVLLGSILLLAGFIWVLVGDRQFEDRWVGRPDPEDRVVEAPSPSQIVPSSASGDPAGRAADEPKRPPRTGRAA